MTWLDVCNDKTLQDLPYKIELNRAGKIIMSPTRNRHGYFAARITHLLRELMKTGEVFVELAIETEDSTKVADVAWAAPETVAIIQDQISASKAPEICVEVTSPCNSDEELEWKRNLYLKAGARECWICDEDGRLEFYNSSGKLPRSSICPAFPSTLPE